METLKKWPNSMNIPFWEVKRASILAELGELDDALRIASNALYEIRMRIKPYEVDYEVLSQEGWTIVLLRVIKQALSFKKETEAADEDFRNRLDTLSNYKCNPYNEIDLQANSVKTWKKKGGDDLK